MLIATWESYKWRADNNTNVFCEPFLMFLYCIVRQKLLAAFFIASTGKFAIYQFLFVLPDCNQHRLLLSVDIPVS